MGHDSNEKDSKVVAAGTVCRRLGGSPLFVLFGFAGWALAVVLWYQRDGGQPCSPAATECHGGGAANQPNAAKAPATGAEAGQPSGVKSAAASSSGTVGGGTEGICSAAEKFLRIPDPATRLGRFVALLDSMRPEEAESVNRLLCGLLLKGGDFQAEYSAFLARWGAVAPHQALRYFENGDPLGVNAASHHHIVSGWASVDAPAALAWIKSRAQGQPGWDSWDALFDGWVYADPGQAEAFLLASPPPGEGLLLGAMSVAKAKFTRDGGVEALRWIASFPATADHTKAAPRVLENMALMISRLPPSEAAEGWVHLAKTPWAGLAEFVRFCHAAAAGPGKTGGMDGLYQELAKAWPPAEITTKFREWSAADPAAAKAWLERVPAGPFADAAKAGIELPTN